MKKIMYGNSLMLLSIGLFILMGQQTIPPYLDLPAIILLAVGFVMATSEFFRKDS